MASGIAVLFCAEEAKTGYLELGRRDSSTIGRTGGSGGNDTWRSAGGTAEETAEDGGIAEETADSSTRGRRDSSTRGTQESGRRRRRRRKSGLHRRNLATPTPEGGEKSRF